MVQLKVLELFSGVGCQTQALTNLGIEHISTQCEIDKYAVNTYNQLHGETPNLGDITKVDINSLKEGQFDLITYSSPCFVGDTLVMTSQGYKQIKDIKIGDLIITHTGKYKAVINVFDNGIKEILKIKGMGFDEIKCTPNHKFYVRKMKYRYVDKGGKTKEGWKRKTKEKYFDIPKWIEAKDLEKGCYLGVPLNNNEIIPIWSGVDYKWSDGRKNRHKNTLEKYMDNSYFWWIVGRFIGDGWLNDNGIKICTSHSELNEVTDVLDILNIHYCVIKERTVYKIQIASKEYMSFFSQFGRGALNKHLTGIIFDLPCKLLKSFIEGYLSADGCNIKGIRKVTTVSRELAYGIAYCIMKAYHKPISLYKYKRENKYQIEKRIVNQHDTYQIRFNDYESPSNKAFYENGYIWLPFNKKEYYGKDNVYDIEIEDDHSFTAQNVIVHNCQDFSICGLNKGGDKGSGTRSSLLFECEKIIRKVKPKYLLFENVKNLLSDQHIHNFMEWLNILRDMGYRNYYQVLNAKDYGIPQNRERVFCVSILGEDSCFEFPQKEELKLRLKDMLEDSPNEKYYLSKKVQDRFVFKKMGENVVGTTAPDGELGEFYRCYSKEGIIGTLKGVEYKQPKQIFEPQETNKIIEMNKEARHQQDLVQHEDGLCRCIPAGTHGSTPHLLKTMVKKEPKIDRIGGMYGQATRWGVYNKEGICPTIVASMGEGGGHVPMVEEKKEPQINQVGELDTKGFECCRRVYGTDGLSPAVTAMGGDHVHKIVEPMNTEPDGTAHTIKAQYQNSSLANFTRKGSYAATGVIERIVPKQPQINKVEIAQKVRIRKNEIDIDSLKALLKKSKQEINKTTKEIAEELDRPITEVEHWFRADDSFSVPSEDIWFDLKDTLNIQTDEFDKAITEFIEKDNTYDIRNRAYKDNGISPTLTTANIPNVVEEEPKFNNKRLNETIEKNKDQIRDGSFIDSYNKTINNDIAGTITTRVSSSNCTHIAEEEKEERLSKQAYETLEENNCQDGDIINPFNKKVTTDGICPTITTRPEGFKTANLVVVDDRQGFLFDMEEQNSDIDVKVDDSCYPKVAKNFEREKNAIANSNKDIYYPKCESGFQDNHVGLKVSATIRATNDNNFALDNHFRIRKLTPRECWRLMGWKDEQFNKIKGISNAQLYKQAGNGIVVNVLEAIFRQMFLVKYDKTKMSITGEQLDLF